MQKNFNILAIDPGKFKWGYAIVTQQGQILKKGIESVEDLQGFAQQLQSEYQVSCIVLGNQTNSSYFHDQLKDMGLEIELIDEAYSSQEARSLFFEIHPPRGWRKLIPGFLLYPERDYDDITAVVLARRYLLKGTVE